MYQYIFMCPH